MNKKNVIVQCFLICLIVGLYVLSGFINTDAESEKKTEEKEKPTVSQNVQNKKDEVKIPEKQEKEEKEDNEKEEVHEYIFERLEAEEPDPDRTLPRDKYSLPFPMTTRSDRFLSIVAPVTEKCDKTYFDDAVFVGDSVTLGLQNYVMKHRRDEPDFLGFSRFISVGSYSVSEALKPNGENSIHKYFNEVRMSAPDICAEYEAGKIFICLGLNDIALFSEDAFKANYVKLINNFREKNPSAKIILQTVTPITLYGERQSLYNARIDEFNEIIAEIAKENDCYLLDIADIMKDRDGYLARPLSSDDYCHLTEAAYERWVDYLIYHGVGLK